MVPRPRISPFCSVPVEQSTTGQTYRLSVGEARWPGSQKRPNQELTVLRSGRPDVDLLHDRGSPRKSSVYPKGSRAFKAWRMVAAHTMSLTPPSISESHSALGPAQTRVILLLLNYFGCFFSKTSKRSRGKGGDRTS